MTDFLTLFCVVYTLVDMLERAAKHIPEWLAR